MATSNPESGGNQIGEVNETMKSLNIAATPAPEIEHHQFDEIDHYLHELGRAPSNDLKKSMRRLSAAMESIQRTSSVGEMIKANFRNLPSAQLTAEIEKKFLLWDKDFDGHLCRGEIVLAMSELGREVSHEEVEELFETYDRDQDEHIDLEEFEVWVRSLVRADKEAEKKSKDKKGRRSSASAPAAPPSK